MEIVKKVEIVTISLEMSKVLEVLEEVGITGYTVIRDVIGKGERGLTANDLEKDVLSNRYVMTVCTAEQEELLVEAIRPILKKFGGVCIVSDAKWIRH
ncbi:MULTISPECIES: P-II family nitrogen regulator [Planktothricoides]|uniref:P-II family nitrogen regulator n=2 Tax=Planktothricoides raciborskii TaxID=132608 RepID=A0AAU8JAF3_9CYAN|nr:MULTISPECIES: P-II family nitrogen regulator [Planktothricoides]KOR35776.1 transcriptional regulator [Planktothricoides sp. SR001]MBD2542922.1 transcriptional regulator [Planktothricoides raciborskii FACHB-1370]MBD2581798.1 transcriptional regulator [Planktothricoides raciborskii FACHB-1261]